MWTRNPGAQRMFDLEAYRSDPDLRVAAWRMRMGSEIRTAQPNRGHEVVAGWENRGLRVTVATQNIDGLQQRAGSSEVWELHGSYWESMCLSCDERRPVQDVFDRVTAGDPDPACLRCGGILKTGTVAFGQALPPIPWRASVSAAEECDLAVAIGSTLSVQPAASLCDVALQSGAPLIIINGGPTAADDRATLLVTAAIGQALTAIDALLD